MDKVIAVFGAGSGLGMSVARRFGREGYKVALIARGRPALEDKARELGSAGIHAEVSPPISRKRPRSRHSLQKFSPLSAASTLFTTRLPRRMPSSPLAR